MKQYIVFLVGALSIFGSVFLFSTHVRGNDQSIVITEIGAAETSGYEWIEIINISDSSIDLDGWKFFEADTNHGLSLIQGDDTILDPGGYAVITQNDINFLERYSNITATIFDSSWGTLNESGEEIGLKNADGNFVEQFTYISASDFSLERIDVNSDDYSEANWKEHPDGNTVAAQNYWHVDNKNENPEPEPEETNEPPIASFSISTSSVVVNTEITFDASASTDDNTIASYIWNFGDASADTTVTATHTYTVTGTFSVSLTVTDEEGLSASTTTNIEILDVTKEIENPDPTPEETTSSTINITINEFLPNPNADENEWIELYNSSTSSIDLTGWILYDGAGQLATPTSTIEAKGYIVIDLASSKLNNGGDIITIKNQEEKTIDEISYGDWDGASVAAPKKGNTIAKNENESFEETTSHTKGELNIITTPPSDDPSSTNNNGGGGGSGENVIQPTTQTYTDGVIVINELVSDPTDEQEEFVELFNTNDATISLVGWWIEDGSETKTSLEGSLKSKGFLAIEKPKGNLNNSGDTVILFDPSGKEIDQVTYGTWDDGNMNDNAPAPDDPLSLARRIDGLDADNDFYDFVLTETVTKEKTNIISLTTTDGNETGQVLGTKIYTSPVKITEIYPNPPGSDSKDEFIELYNSGAETTDITNWKLGDGSSKRYTIKEGNIAPGAYIVLKRAMTSIALNNSGGDEVGLYDPNGAIVEKAQYKGSAAEGESWSRKEDGSWAWTTEVTPSEANKISGKSAAPIIAIDVDTEVAVDELVKFDASDTTDPDAEEMTFVWSFGDNGTDEGDIVEHAFSDEGTYTVTLSVTDASNNSAAQDVIVMVKNRLSFVGGFNPETPIEKIEISEILPNPEGSDTTEFIELFNPTDEHIDLTDMKLDDEEGGSRAYSIPEGTIINAGMYLIFGRQDTKIAFNNTSDSARILYPDGTVLRNIRYDDVLEGHSFVQDENEEWTWTSTLTPGEATILSPPDNKKISKTTRSKSKMVKPVIRTTLTKLRSEDVGDLVTVTGTVAVLPNIFGTQYFYIVGSPGVQVYMHSKDFPNLAVGDVVEITGEISEASGETRVKLKEKTDIEIIEHAAIPHAISLDIAATGEEYEGWLVEVHGEITELKSSYMYVDDGTDEIKVYFKRGAGINTKIYQLGDLVKVSGIISQTKTGYRLLPRSSTDIIKTGVIEDVIVRQDAIKEESSKEVAEKYLTATAGGLTALLVGLVARTKGGWIKRISLFFRRRKKEGN
jgi:PKD repeat protein